MEYRPAPLACVRRWLVNYVILVGLVRRWKNAKTYIIEYKLHEVWKHQNHGLQAVIKVFTT